MTKKLAPVAPTGVAFRIRTVYYSTNLGVGRIRVEVHIPGVGKVQQLAVPYEHAARDPHRFAIQQAFGQNALTIQSNYERKRARGRANGAFPNEREWLGWSDMNNYAVVNADGKLVRWFADGNDAIAYRDEFDHYTRNPRFASSVLTSGQYAQLKSGKR